jgi:hypothetical protein
VREIANLRALAESIVAKSTKFITRTEICDGIRQGNINSLKEFAMNAKPEVVAAFVKKHC